MEKPASATIPHAPPLDLPEEAPEWGITRGFWLANKYPACRNAKFDDLRAASGATSEDSSCAEASPKVAREATHEGARGGNGE